MIGIVEMSRKSLTLADKNGSIPSDYLERWLDFHFQKLIVNAIAIPVQDNVNGELTQTFEDISYLSYLYILAFLMFFRVFIIFTLILLNFSFDFINCTYLYSPGPLIMLWIPASLLNGQNGLPLLNIVTYMYLLTFSWNE